MSNFPKIIYKDRNVIVINKPVGMPSQSDPTGDTDAMSATSELLSGMGEIPSLWLVHRLDRTVGGLIAFARNKKAAAELSKLVADSGMDKKYLAVCHGEAKCGEYVDLLFKDSATNKAYIVKTARRGAKEARLSVERLDTSDGKSLLSIELYTGRFHQIRAQLSARGNSLVGDKKYGSRDEVRRTPSLFAYKLSFLLFGKKITVCDLPNTEEYPWNVFSKEQYIKATKSE